MRVGASARGGMYGGTAPLFFDKYPCLEKVAGVILIFYDNTHFHRFYALAPRRWVKIQAVAT